ncbi:MAG: hypothetical protein KGJ57_05040 [Sphingomonadales bacterium]|nr:hypothetical protein [Sphingomonadales bacterium]MDE2168782.1 hypothetical protein [Sphingomonadales bacterium]
MMKRATAAAYLDMSEAAFEREIISGRMPGPVKFGGRDHWKRSAIDACLERLTGDDSVPDYRRELREKCAKARDARAAQ